MVDSRFEKRLGAAFITGLVRAGLSPTLAERGSACYSSIGSWTASQISQAAVVGAAAPWLPGWWLLGGLAADVAIVAHKIPTMTWGIGYLSDAVVEPREDMANVVGLWLDSLSDDGLVKLTKDVVSAGVPVAGSILLARWIDGGDLVGVLAGRHSTVDRALAVVTGAAGKPIGATVASAVAKALLTGTAMLTNEDTTSQVFKHNLGRYNSEALDALGRKVIDGIQQFGVGRSVRLGGSALLTTFNVWIMAGIAREARHYYATKAGW